MNFNAAQLAVLAAATALLAPAPAHARADLGAKTRVGVFAEVAALDVGARDDSSAETHRGISLEGCESAVDSRRYYDAETELHENGHRFYDPETGRYLQPESILRSPYAQTLYVYWGQPLPAYSYAINNPMAWVDLDGLRPIRTAGDAIQRYRELMTATAQWYRNEGLPTSPWGQLLHHENYYREFFGLKQRYYPNAGGDAACGGATRSLAEYLRSHVDMEDVNIGERTGAWMFGNSHTTTQIDLRTKSGDVAIHVGVDPFNLPFSPIQSIWAGKSEVRIGNVGVQSTSPFGFMP